MMRKKLLTLTIGLVIGVLGTAPAAYAQQVNNLAASDSLTLTLQQVDSISQFLPVMYSNKGCGRCVTAARYFDEKKIPNLKLDLAIQPNGQVMYQLASRAAGKPNIAIMYPVVAYKGVVYYGEYPLNEFLEKFSASYQSSAKQ
ncbi:MAG: hypothetical protein ACP5O2_04090 [Bacteroidales bacterium]